MVEVLVARFDHLGYQLEEGVRSEVVGMAILHGSADLPLLLAVMVRRRPRVSSDYEIIHFLVMVMIKDYVTSRRAGCGMEMLRQENLNLSLGNRG